jgi:hypothetical protein
MGCLEDSGVTVLYIGRTDLVSEHFKRDDLPGEMLCLIVRSAKWARNVTITTQYKLYVPPVLTLKDL